MGVFIGLADVIIQYMETSELNEALRDIEVCCSGFRV